MTVLQKFMFDRSFDKPSAESVRRKREEAEAAKRQEETAVEAQEESAEPEAPPAPTYSEDDIAAARAQGFQDGKQAGNQEAWTQFRTQTDQMAVKGLKVIGDNMQALVGDVQASNQTAYRDAITVAVAVVQKLFPVLAERGATDEVEAVVADCLRRLQPEPRVIVKVNGYIAEALQDRLEPLIEELGFDGQLILEVDDNLAQTDCRVSWAGGGAARNGEDMWKAVNGSISKILGIDPVALMAGEPASAHSDVDADVGDFEAVPEGPSDDTLEIGDEDSGADELASELLSDDGDAADVAGSPAGDDGFGEESLDLEGADDIDLMGQDGPTGEAEAPEDDLELEEVP